MKATLIALILALALPATADTEALFSLYTDHVGDDKRYNEATRLFAVRHDRLIGGTLVNSHHQRTYFGAGIYEWGDIFRYGAMGGFVYGYCEELLDSRRHDPKACQPEPMPFVSPHAGIQVQDLSIRGHIFANSVIITVGFAL